jgi:hypothetical protein
MLYTGLDLHRSFSYITTMNDKGEIVSQKKLPSNGEIAEFLKEFDDTMKVAIEANPGWYWLFVASLCRQTRGSEEIDNRLNQNHTDNYGSQKVDKIKGLYYKPEFITLDSVHNDNLVL